MYERSGNIIRQKFREYLLSTVLTSMAISMASVVDGIIVGSLLGDVALAAVGLSSPVIFCINLIYMLFAIGGLTCAAIAQGKRDLQQTNQIFTLSIGGGLAAMCIFLAVMQAALHPLSTRLAGGDLHLAALTESYLRPLLFTGPALMFSSGMAMFIRSDGRPKASAVIVMIANAVNLLLDYVLIRFLHTGIAGAGLSTTLGYVAGSVIVIPYLLSKKRSFHFTALGKNALKTLAAILKTGLPKAVSHVCNLLRSLAVNGIIVASMGAIGMSIMTVCTNVLMIANIFIGGISDALLPIVGTLYGERDYFGMKQAMKAARTVLAACCAVLVAFLLIAPQMIGMAFGIRSPEAIALLKPALRLFALYIPFFAFLLLHQNFYNTTERRSLATALVVMDGLLFVLPFAALFSAIQANLLWLCYAVSGSCTLLALLVLVRRIQRKEDVQGLLVIRENKDAINRYDFTIAATEAEAVRLSERVMELSAQIPERAELIYKIALAMEEMVVCIAHYAHAGREPGQIDVLVYVTEHQVLVQLRDNGTAFNALDFIPEKNDGCITDGIRLVKALSSSMEFSRRLGLNTISLTFELSAK